MTWLALMRFKLFQALGEVLAWAILDPDSLPVLLAFVLLVHVLVMTLWLHQTGRL